MKAEFESLSVDDKIFSLGMRATAVFAKNENEYASVTINPFAFGKHRVFQVYFVMWDESVRVKCFDIDTASVVEEETLDAGLNELNAWLVPFEQKILAKAVETTEHAIQQVARLFECDMFLQGKRSLSYMGIEPQE